MLRSRLPKETPKLVIPGDLSRPVPSFVEEAKSRETKNLVAAGHSVASLRSA